MKNIRIGFLLLFISTFIACFRQIKEADSDSKPISHALFDSLLRKYVNRDGLVDYKGFIKDSVAFSDYLNLLSKNHPNEKNWSRDERLAYWLNAYNAFTIKLICNNYPVQSIKDIKKGVPFVSDTWTIDFIKIENRTYSLNNIEHNIVRPTFNDPRVHFALNCASMSCPKLLGEAYRGDILNKQLDSQAQDFLKDTQRNKITNTNKAELSKLFTWFAGDFKKVEPSVVAFINRYSDIKLAENAQIDYLDYDWNLNQQK
jgi:Protein of unknown function, DUF547